MKQLKSIGRRIYRNALPATFRSSLRMWMALDWPDEEPQAVDTFTDKPVLVLAPHMDDEVIGPGGAVRRHVLAGAKATVAVMTDGRWGGYDPDGTLVARRKAESIAAAKIVGTELPVFLDGPDNELTDGPQWVDAVADLILRRDPSVIYLPALTDKHRDHWATNRILYSALKKLPPSLRDRLIIRGYEVWSPLTVNRLIDISTVVDNKRAAIGAFPSQTSVNDYSTAVLGLNAYRALRLQHGQGFAEAFMELSVKEFEWLFAAVNPRHEMPLAA